MSVRGKLRLDSDARQIVRAVIATAKIKKGFFRRDYDTFGVFNKT
jgi:hypothetical protein